MGLLLPIITKSIMGNNESSITHYEPTQLADEILNLGRAALAPRAIVDHFPFKLQLNVLQINLKNCAHFQIECSQQHCK